MRRRRRQLNAGRVTLGGLLLAALIGLQTPPAAGQTSVGTTTPDGTSVGMGVIRNDSADDAEAERRRRQKRFAELIAEARGHVEAGEWLPARKRLDEARRNVTDKATDLPPMRELYQALEKQGQTMLGSANRAYSEEDYGTALAGFSEVVRIFKGLPSADQAADALAMAQEDENVKMYLADQAAQALARRIDTIIANHRAQAAADGEVDSDGAAEDEHGVGGISRVEAIRALPVGKQVEIVDVMESIVDQFSATPTGARVEGELAALEADEALMAAINAVRHDRKAAQALKRAQMYHKGGMPEKALGYYKAVVADYPDHEAAETARQAIDEITAQLGG